MRIGKKVSKALFKVNVVLCVAFGVAVATGLVVESALGLKQGLVPSTKLSPMILILVFIAAGLLMIYFLGFIPIEGEARRQHYLRVIKKVSETPGFVSSCFVFLAYFPVLKKWVSISESLWISISLAYFIFILYSLTVGEWVKKWFKSLLVEKVNEFGIRKAVQLSEEMKDLVPSLEEWKHNRWIPPKPEQLSLLLENASGLLVDDSVWFWSHRYLKLIEVAKRMNLEIATPKVGTSRIFFKKKVWFLSINLVRVLDVCSFNPKFFGLLGNEAKKIFKGFR